MSTGRVLGRFDLAVAVFFTLSGFLLWRGHAAAARGLRQRPPTGHYLRSRIVRIMPGYLVAVVVILTLMPDVNADLTVWLANLTLTQIYVPLTLTAGLTQMWSLSVEVSFYLALPFFALLARRLPVPRSRARARGVGGRQPGVGLIPFDAPFGVNPMNWPPAFFSWFAAGHGARRVDRQPGRLGAPAGAAPRPDGGRRGGGVRGRGLAHRRARGADAGHGGPVRREDGDGRGGRRGAAGTAGAGRSRHAAPVPGQRRRW